MIGLIERNNFLWFKATDHLLPGGDHAATNDHHQDADDGAGELADGDVAEDPMERSPQMGTGHENGVEEDVGGAGGDGDGQAPGVQCVFQLHEEQSMDSGKAAKVAKGLLRKRRPSSRQVMQ